MRQVPGAAFNGTASSLEVDPEEVTHEWFLEVAIDFRMIDDPQQLIDRQNRLTHRLYETVLALQVFNLINAQLIGRYATTAFLN